MSNTNAPMGFIVNFGVAEADQKLTDIVPEQRVAELLGLDHSRSEIEMVELIQTGFANNCIASLRKTGLTDQELFAVIIQRRTYSRRVAHNEKLAPEESDRALRVARLTSLAERVFGDNKRALAWLRSSKRTLDNKSPVEMMVTEAGARVVEEMLHRVDDGIYA